MFRLAGTFLWVWAGGTQAPHVLMAPVWAQQHHVIKERVWKMSVNVIHVQPGRQWDPDPTLETFLLEEL